MRAQRFEALTTDHGAEAEPEPAPDAPAPSEFAISRAVGGEEMLELDLRREAVLAGDRILLCSDGLTRTIEEGEIAKVLADSTLAPAACARRLVDASLAANAKDNVTVVVIDVR
jgi:serine/threonine protein phosphatase PrpC